MTLAAHVEWLVGHMGRALEAELARQGATVDVRTALTVLCEADPSPGQVAVQWMAERLLDGGLLWEDVRSGLGSKTHETLVAFEAHRRTLTGPGRRLEGHHTLASAWTAVAHLVSQGAQDVDEPGIRELRRQQRDAARAESEILVERPGLIIAVPLTERAAKWWGRGTRWCTAADNDNAFETYAADGILIVVVLPDQKFQLFVTGRAGFGDKAHMDTDESSFEDVTACGRFQFNDAMDAEVLPEQVAQRWNELGDLVLWAVRHAPRMVPLIPPPFASGDMWRRAVKGKSRLLSSVPAGLIDRDMCLMVLQRDGNMLWAVPDSLLDRDMCLAAVSGWTGVLRHVPLRLCDPDIYRAAIAKDVEALRHIPEHEQNREMWLSSVCQHGTSLEDVPVSMRDRELCLIAVSTSGHTLEHVPEHMRDRDVCLAAVSKSGHALENVPEDMRDRDVCLAAVSHRFGQALRYVPMPLRDRDMCLAAVSNGRGNLEKVPMDLRTMEICAAAIAMDPWALRDVPLELRERDMCLQAMKKSGRDLEHVPMHLRDRNMCVSAVFQETCALQHVPESLLDQDMFLVAVRSWNFYLSSINVEHRNRQVCLAAVAADGENLYSVPDSLRDQKMCETAVRASSHAIRWVPKAIREQVAALVMPTRLDTRTLEEIRSEHRLLHDLREAVMSVDCLGQADTASWSGHLEVDVEVPAPADPGPWWEC